MRCSLALLCLPLLVPQVGAQQEPFLVQMDRQVLVRMAPNEVVLNVELLGAIAGSTEARQAVVKALGKRLGDPNQCAVQAREVNAGAPQPAGVFQFALVVTGKVTDSLDLAAEDAVMRAAIEVLRHRLEALLIDGRRQELSGRAHELDARLHQAEAQREEASIRLLQLGGEDPGAAQKLLVELQHRRLDAELDLHTEEALQERMQKLIDAARQRLAEAGARVDTVVSEGGRLSSALAEQRKSLGAASDKLALETLQKELLNGEARAQDLQRQRATASEALAAEARFMQELAAQATASTIALNRHASRLQVLQSAMEQQGKHAAEALTRAMERGKIEQLVRRSDDTITMLRARLMDVNQRLESLQPIRVELWR